MGFFIQDDYFNEAVKSFASERDQDRFWGLLIRYYFTGEDCSKGAKLPVKTAFAMTKARIDKARSNADRMRTVRAQCANSASTVHAQNASYLKESERESEREIESNDDVVVIETLYKGGEIGAEDGFAHFQAGALKRFNATTGQNYMGVTAASRQGMLDAFRAGRTLDDVDRVMDEVATWERKYQTLDAVWAGGKFEKHLNRAEASKPVTHPVEASCPRCGETCAAVNPGMYRCKRCDITWRAS